MFIAGDELVLLRDLGTVFLASCEGVVGWARRADVRLDSLAGTSSPPRRASVVSLAVPLPQTTFTAPSPPVRTGRLPSLEDEPYVPTPMSDSLEPTRTDLKRVSGPFELDSPASTPGLETDKQTFFAQQRTSREVEEKQSGEPNRGSMLSTTSSDALGGIGGFMIGRGTEESYGHSLSHEDGIEEIQTESSPTATSVRTPLDTSFSAALATRTSSLAHRSDSMGHSPSPSPSSPSPSISRSSKVREGSSGAESEREPYSDYGRQSMYGSETKSSLDPERASRSPQPRASHLSGYGDSFRISVADDGAIHAAMAVLTGVQRAASAQSDGRENERPLDYRQEADGSTEQSLATRLRKKIQRDRLEEDEEKEQDDTIPAERGSQPGQLQRRAADPAFRVTMMDPDESHTLSHSADASFVSDAISPGHREISAEQNAEDNSAAQEVTRNSHASLSGRDSAAVKSFEYDGAQIFETPPSPDFTPTAKTLFVAKSTGGAEEEDEIEHLDSTHSSATISPRHSQSAWRVPSPNPSDEQPNKPPMEPYDRSASPIGSSSNGHEQSQQSHTAPLQSSQSSSAHAGATPRLTLSPTLHSSPEKMTTPVFPAVPPRSPMSAPRSPLHSPSPHLTPTMPSKPWAPVPPPDSPSSPHSVAATRQAVEAVRQTPDTPRSRAMTLVGYTETPLSASTGPVPITFLVGGPELAAMTAAAPPSPAVSSSSHSHSHGPNSPLAHGLGPGIGLGLPAGLTAGSDTSSTSSRRNGSPLALASAPIIDGIEGIRNSPSRFPSPPSRSVTSPTGTSSPGAPGPAPAAPSPLAQAVNLDATGPNNYTPARPRSRSFSSALSKAFGISKKENLPPPLPPAEQHPVRPQQSRSASAQTIKGKKSLGALRAPPPDQGVQSPPQMSERSPQPQPAQDSRARPSIVTTPQTTGQSANFPSRSATTDSVSSLPLRPSSPSAQSTTFSMRSSLSISGQGRKVSRGIPLPSPVSHKDYEDTVQENGLDFELVRPNNGMMAPSESSSVPMSPTSPDGAGLQREPTITSTLSKASSRGPLPETDEWGFLRDQSPVPQVFQGRSSAEMTRAMEQRWLSILSTPIPADGAPKKVRKLVIESGIPASLRGKVWGWFMSGSMSARVPGLYQQLLEQGKSRVEENQIERDIATHWSDHSIFAAPDSPGLADLRNLLKAYSNFAPGGYSGPMVLVAGTLLIHCPVEDSFWLLNGLINGALKECYMQAKIGMRVDAEVFKKVVEGSEKEIGQLFKECVVHREWCGDQTARWVADAKQQGSTSRGGTRRSLCSVYRGPRRSESLTRSSPRGRGTSWLRPWRS